MATTKRATKSAARTATTRAASSRRPRADVPFIGREAERARLGAAMARGVLPSVLLIAGAQGIGKQRLAGWVAQALVCEAPTATGAPCDGCGACHRARALVHPDIHWYAPHASVGGGSVDQQIEAVATARAELLERWRADALATTPEVGVAYYVATIQAMRRAAFRTAVEGRRKVFIIGDAERLVLAEGAAGEAANGLLKLLEEPPPGTHFLLTSSAPHRIPATVRSRATEVRLAPLGVSTLTAICAAAGVDPAEPAVAQAIAEAHGSVRAVMQRLDTDWQEVRGKARQMMAAALTGDHVARFTAVKAQGFGDARGSFSALLGHLEALCVEGARRTAAPGTAQGDTAFAALLDTLGRPLPSVDRWAAAARAALDAWRSAQGNENPQLVLHALLWQFATLLGPEAA